MTRQPKTRLARTETGEETRFIARTRGLTHGDGKLVYPNHGVKCKDQAHCYNRVY